MKKINTNYTTLFQYQIERISEQMLKKDVLELNKKLYILGS